MVHVATDHDTGQVDIQPFEFLTGTSATNFKRSRSWPHHADAVNSLPGWNRTPNETIGGTTTGPTAAGLVEREVNFPVNLPCVRLVRPCQG